MARQVLPIVGAIVGGFFGAPQLGFAIGSIVGGLVDPEVIKGPRIGESNLQTSAEGVFRPVVIGTGAVKGNVIDRGNRRVWTQEEGGKGGPVTETQRVSWTFAIRICEGPIDAVTRIWMDEKLVYDIRPESVIVDESFDFAESFRLYLGGEAQLPDPDLEAFRGAGNVNAYRGSAYIVFPDFDLTDRRESIPDFRFEVASSADVSSIVTPWEYVGELGVHMRDAAFAGSAWAAVGGNSADNTGSLWLGQPDGTGFAEAVGVMVGLSPHSVAYGDGIIAVSCDSNKVVWGPIGGPYITSNTASTDAYRRIHYTGARWVRLGQNGAAEWATHPSGPWTYSPFGGATNADVTENVGGGVIIVFADNGSIRRTPDGGDSWSTPGTTGTDPFPSAPFTGAASEVGRIRAYKNIDVSTMVVYTSTNGGVTFAITTEAVMGASYEGGPIGVIDGRWIGGRFAATPLPDYPHPFASADGLNPFTSENVENGLSAGSASSFIVRVVDSGADREIGLILGQTDGGSFVYRNDYSGGEEADIHPIPLGDIVASLHARIGHGAGLYDVSELTQLVRGVVFAGDYTVADAIRTLMSVYFFDAAEFDGGAGYKLHYPLRGKPVVRTLTEADLLEAPEKTVREDALERPRVLHLHYENPDVGYVAAKATTLRSSPDILVTGERSVQVPVNFANVDEPAQTSAKLMKIAWVEVAGERQFIIHDGNLDLVPGDCIGISLRGQTQRWRTVQQMIGPGQIDMRLIRDRQSAYTSNTTGVPVPPPTPPLPSIVGPTIHEMLDIPALNDGNDRLLWYEAATGQSEAWYGAQTQRKIAPATEFTNSARFTFGTVMGALLDPVAAASPHYSDRTNVVRVELYRPGDTLEALTHAQFLSEGGAFALENDDGTWEVLQYRDVEEDSSGAFALSYLARGRLNTGATAHSPGARFVLLDAVIAVDTQTGWIGSDVVMRAVSFGQAPDAATQTTYAYTGQSQREFPVAHLFLDRAGDTVTATTVPRHRFGTEDAPVRSINWTSYRWTATDGANSATIDTIAATADFDVTGWGSPVTVTVAQVNRLTGPGPTVSEQIA